MSKKTSKQMPYMVLDLSKKPGDENAVKTGDMLLAENERMREALSDILDRIDQWRTDGTLEHWQYSQLFDLADGALAEGREGGNNAD